ncbi:hypothetical protein [Streptomyces sp. NPDC006551]|uniref:hypothetical protein n=1 Tax=Streptomyces sp. NPDC006551 TaxID=3157178 RepID=UPI0033B15537
MSFDEEWAAARAAAGENAAMRLNQAPTDPGGGAGGKPHLKVDDDHIGRIGSEAFKLHNHLRADGTHAKAATSGAAADLAKGSFASGAALRTVHDKWDAQVQLLVAACANISNHLDYSAKTWVREEERLIATFRASEIHQYLK